MSPCVSVSCHCHTPSRHTLHVTLFMLHPHYITPRTSHSHVTSSPRHTHSKFFLLCLLPHGSSLCSPLFFCFPCVAVMFVLLPSCLLTMTCLVFLVDCYIVWSKLSFCRGPAAKIYMSSFDYVTGEIYSWLPSS